MRKIIYLFVLLFTCLISKSYGLDSDLFAKSLNVATNIERFDEESTHYFYLDPESVVSDEFLRVCVPLAYSNWFSVRKDSISSIEEIGSELIDGKKLLKINIVFRQEFSQLNTILEAFRELVLDEKEDISGLDQNSIEALGFRWRWKPPWTWSRCAKCRLGVNVFITGTVFVAMSGAGPGALAVAKALIAGTYGVAAWEAVKAVIMSASVSEISRKICNATGKC